MKVLGIDFETQGDNAKETNITEIGASLYEFRGEQTVIAEMGSKIHSSGQSQVIDFERLANPPVLVSPWSKIRELSALCYEPEYPDQTAKIVELTGITDEMLKTEGKPRRDVLPGLIEMLKEADIVVAHKISFDRTVLKSTCTKLGIELPEKEWLCTLTNFPWPARLSCKKLSHLAYEHGIMVDPRTLHRAADDVDLMMRLLAQYNFDEVLAYARTPWVYLMAPDILGPWLGKGGDGGTQTTIAKDLGFGWESVKGVDEHKWPKKWVTRVKVDRLEALKDAISASESPFRTVTIEGLS